MSMTKQDVLDLLESKASVLRSDLYEVQNKISALRKEIWHDTTGINIGDTVSFMDGREEKTGELVRIDNSSAQYPYVRLHRKDGSLGTRQARVWRTETLKKK